MVSHSGVCNYVVSKNGSIIKKKCYSCFLGSHSLIKVMGGSTARFLPGAVRQLGLLPRVDTTSHFYTLQRTRNTILMVLERTNEKCCDSEWIEA